MTSSRARDSTEAQTVHRETLLRRLALKDGTERAQTHAGPQSREGKLGGIGDHRAGRGDDENLFGDRLEVRAEMNRALERENLLRARLDAEMTEDRLIRRLQFLFGDDDADTADAQQRHLAETRLDATIHRPR